MIQDNFRVILIYKVFPNTLKFSTYFVLSFVIPLVTLNCIRCSHIICIFSCTQNIEDYFYTQTILDFFIEKYRFAKLACIPGHGNLHFVLNLLVSFLMYAMCKVALYMHLLPYSKALWQVQQEESDVFSLV